MKILKHLPAVFLVYLSLSYEAKANTIDCERLADSAYKAAIEYQITGKTDNKVLAATKIEINFFDKKFAAKKYMWHVVDMCKK